MLYAEKQESLKGDFCVWVLPALAHKANQPWHICAARWLEIEALELIETKNESNEDSVNALGW